MTNKTDGQRLEELEDAIALPTSQPGAGGDPFEEEVWQALRNTVDYDLPYEAVVRQMRAILESYGQAVNEAIELLDDLDD